MANGASVIVPPGGAVFIPNVSVPDTYGPGGPGTAQDGLGDDFIRMTGFRVMPDGTTWYAYGEYFQLNDDQSYAIQGMTVTQTPPPSVCALEFADSAVVIQGIGATAQLTVTAKLNDGGMADVTPADAWTSYRTSNPAVANVSKDGLVTGMGAGTALITALNDGAAAVKEVVVTAVAPTTLVGHVVLPGPIPVSAASVSIPILGLTALTAADGSYTLGPVASDLPDLQVYATASVSGESLLGYSEKLAGIPNGMTDAGTIVLAPCAFDPVLGTPLGLFDDEGTQVALAVLGEFPFFGEAKTAVFVNANGNVTFSAVDTDYTPTIQEATSIARISPLWADLDPSEGGAVYVKQQADRLVVTWNEIPEYGYGGANSVQLVVNKSGIIDFVYHGVSATGSTGEAVVIALAKGVGGTGVAMDFSSIVGNYSGGANGAFHERFDAASAFDLDVSCLRFTPNGAGGYDIKRYATAQPKLLVARGYAQDRTGSVLDGARVIIRSSGRPGHAFTTITDRSGRFSLPAILVPGAVIAEAWVGSRLAATATVPFVSNRASFVEFSDWRVPNRHRKR